MQVPERTGQFKKQVVPFRTTPPTPERNKKHVLQAEHSQHVLPIEKILDDGPKFWQVWSGTAWARAKNDVVELCVCWFAASSTLPMLHLP